MRRVRLRTSAALTLACAAGLSGCSLGGQSDRPPQLGAKSDDKEAAVKLGFPSSATKNTIRVGGADAITDAAGVASAVFPATGNANRPTAVVLVDKDDWQGGVTASVLASRPIGAPILISDGSDLPAVTKDTIDRLKPTGSDLSKDAKVIRIGDKPARPEGLKTAVLQGKDPYERAAAIDRFFSAARGKPSANVVVASGEKAEYSMPAAAWAARSGDSVLLTKRNSLPAATTKAIKAHPDASIYVLGPPAAVSSKVVSQLKKLGKVVRIQGRTPVTNAIAFARYQKRGFGWGVVVPGYNFTVAGTSRPLDAAASAALATRGVFAPLLLTDQAKEIPKALEEYLLSVQPGYEDDPGQAVYNRVWLLGDDKQISVAQQARIDQITELIPVQANAP